MLVDPGSFHEIDQHLASSDPLTFADDRPYQERLTEQQARLGQADGVISGTARLRDRPIVIAVLDFAFMGGSMGVVVGEKIARAAARAEKERIPLVTVVASGGARMQEGMLSLLQMAKTVAAVEHFQARGGLYLSILTDPTTGGVFASFASLGDLILAEPGALIGFAGPRVVEQTIGESLPPGSHTAEFLLEHGMIDAIVPRPELADLLARILTALPSRPAGKLQPPKNTAADLPQGAPQDPWQIVLEARSERRPTALDYIAGVIDSFVELHGDRLFADDPAVVAGFGLLAGRPVAIIGLERGHGQEREARRFGRPYPEGFRKAQRLMHLAERWQLPLLTLIDTPGAYPGLAAEERGLGAAIATSLAAMAGLTIPTVAAIIGEGGSGGALALAMADRVVMQERAIYSVIAPEGAAAILYRDAGRAPEIAARLKLTAADLKALGIIDTIVPEPANGAAAAPAEAIAALRDAVLTALSELHSVSPERRRAARFRRYRDIGRQWTKGKPGQDAPSAEGILTTTAPRAKSLGDPANSV